MYEMFTGRVPFEADSYMGVLTKHMYMAPAPLSQITGTDKLAALEDVTLRCLEKKPEHRYATLRELVEDLDRVFVATGQHRGTPRHRRVTPRSVLADELELPSREELTLGLEQAGLKPWPRWPIALIGGLFLLGIGSVLALRGGKVAPSAGSGAESVPPPASAAVTLAVPSHVAPPAPSASPATVATAAPSARPPTASVASPVPVKAVPRRVPERSVVTAPVTTPAPAARKKQGTLGVSEIVDPWAK
jgi:serine/threonine-protein kinase